MNEVIIDGCNVAECSLYCNGNCLKYMTEKNSIENVKCNSYCDYGALARQEQLQRAKAENKKLKAEVKEIRTWEELKLSKYRKALEDIKELLRGHQIADEARIEIILGLINKALND